MTAAADMGPLERWARVLLYFAALLAISLGLEVKGHVWCLWLTRRGSAARVARSNAIVRDWGTWCTELTFELLRGRLELDGRVPDGRFVVIANHQSTADIAILIWALRPLNCKFVAKRQLGWAMPSVSTALARMGGALISRRPSKRDVRRLKRMAHELEAWHGTAVLFAEGTRSRDGRLLPYRGAAARVVAREARLPLLPVAIDGTHVASDLPGFARRMPGCKGRLVIGEPIPVERWEGRFDEALDEIRAWAAAEIETARRDGRVPPPAGWRPGETLVRESPKE